MANQILADDDLDQALDALDVERNFLDEDVEKETEPPEQPNNRADESTGLLVDGGTPVECEDDISVEDGGWSPLLVALALVIAVVVVVVVVVAVIISIPFWILVLVLLLVLFVIARTRIPPPASFHAKKEIKRIKRGKHLPQNNNNSNNTDSQKKTWLGKKVTTVKTFLSGEAKDAVGAYDDILFCDVGIGLLVVARDLTNGECFTWLGFLGQWRVLDLSPETHAKLHQWLWKSSNESTTVPY
ncbi:expressed unknown protein [Seminavis robusta]|uniref:Uncharacterized protein n=1 Tax=Seminavis robusta TaxID=568900 RepID=A0A9N8HFU4_9STRA|nr:expressed unknown protein [Seminavis robusta]|eukprot:Sro451_g145740.1 n/a (243) ;mRNA; r:48082-48810